MFQKTIDYKKCTFCMKCKAICTNSQVIVQNKAGRPEFRYDNKCIYCGHCLAVCPEGAITFAPLPGTCGQDGTYCAQAVERNADTPLLGSDSVFDFLCALRSTRIFMDQPVERKKIEAVLDAMVRAASAGNEQNRNLYIVSNPEALGLLEDAQAAHFEKKLKALQHPVNRMLVSFIGALRAGRQNMSAPETTKIPFKKRYGLMQALLKDVASKPGPSFSYLKHAPVLVLITEGKKNSSMHRTFYRGDACIAATYGILMAKALGLASCWMGLLEIALAQNTQIGRLLKLKQGERVEAAFVLGYSDLVWHRLPPRGPVEVTWLT